MAARKLITIEGEQRLYTEGEWVVYDPQGSPDGCMHADAASGDDPVKAAREFWGGSTEAMKYLIKGYRIELMTWERCKREILPQMAAPSSPAEQSSPSCEGEGSPPEEPPLSADERARAAKAQEYLNTLRAQLRSQHTRATLSSPQGSGDA